MLGERGGGRGGIGESRGEEAGRDGDEGMRIAGEFAQVGSGVVMVGDRGGGRGGTGESRGEAGRGGDEGIRIVGTWAWGESGGGVDDSAPACA